MDAAERLAEKYLKHRGYQEIVYEPDGNIPPDFLVDGRIAVEVRRLNQHFTIGSRAIGLEQDAIALNQKIRKIACSFGPPKKGESWFYFFSFRRPLKKRKLLGKDIRSTFSSFVESSHQTDSTVKLGSGFEVRFRRAGECHPNYFVPGGYVDNDAGGWELHELGNNLNIVIPEKSKKVTKFRSRYSEWWLILVDHVTSGLSSEDKKHFEERISIVPHNWNSVILLDPRDHTHDYQLVNKTASP